MAAIVICSLFLCANDDEASNEHFHSQLNFNLFFSRMRKMAKIDWMPRVVGGRKTKREHLITYISILIPDARYHMHVHFVITHPVYFPCSTKCFFFLFFVCHFQWNIYLCVIISWHICLVICKFFSEQDLCWSKSSDNNCENHHHHLMSSKSSNISLHTDNTEKMEFQHEHTHTCPKKANRRTTTRRKRRTHTNANVVLFCHSDQDDVF